MPLQKSLTIWEIWTNYLLREALKNGPKFNKSPNLVTLDLTHLNTIKALVQSHSSTIWAKPRPRSCSLDFSYFHK